MSWRAGWLAFIAVYLGICSALAASTYSDWQAAHFSTDQLSDPATSGVMANPANDGIPNVEKYAFDLDPWVWTPGGIPSLDISGTLPGFDYRKLKSATDLLYHFQYSTDLTNWITPNVPIELASADGGNVWLKALANPISSAPCFYRMKIIYGSGSTESLVAPTDVRAIALPSMQVQIYWTDNSMVETGFVIQRMGPGDSGFVTIGTTGPDTNSFVDSDTPGGTIFNYRIQAVRGGGRQIISSSPVQITTPDWIRLVDLTNAAVKLLTTQIKAATVGCVTDANGTPITNQRLAWASQPGMLRTWDDTGNPYQEFKLYSSANMVVSGAYNPASDTEFADISGVNWVSQPSIYTDLNSPVAVSGTAVSPIIDPNLTLVSGTLTYMNPLGTQTIEGFSVIPPPAAIYDSSQPVSASNNPVPMPVRWMYLLKNGSLVPATPGGSGSTASVSAATTGNPIVGRVAFWADDETCKVNINTASEGTFWDVPLVWNSEEYGSDTSFAPWGFANSVPATAEFQRTPGHPATTCLSTVFGSLLPLPTSAPLVEADYNSYLAPYYMLTPCYTPGGSKGGSRPAWQPTDSAPLASSTYRLFTSVDNLLTDPNGIPLTIADSSLYPPTFGASPTGGRPGLPIDSNVLRQAQFFITANSCAPEVTLFNTPRVCMWPIQSGTSTPELTSGTAARNFKDTLLARGSTINQQPYYFQRASVYEISTVTSSGTTNYGGSPNTIGYGSSQSLTDDFPGFPTSTPQTGVSRNLNIFSYLQSLTQTNIPGFGGSFLAKYPGAGGATDRDQILTEIFDYIRAGVNTLSISLPPLYTYTPYSTSGSWGQYGAGSTIPIQIVTSSGTTQGLGRFVTLKEVTLVFYCANILDETNLNWNANYLTAGNNLIPYQPIPNRNAYTDAYGPMHDLYVANGNLTPPYLPTTPHNGFPGFQANTPVPAPDGLPDDVSADHSGTNGVFDGIGDPQTTQMGCIVLIQPYNLVTGSPFFSANVRYQISGLNNLSISVTGTDTIGAPQVFSYNLGFPSGANAYNLVAQTSNASFSSAGNFFELYEPTNGYSNYYKLLAANNGILSNQTTSDYANNPNRLNFPWYSSVISLPMPAKPSRWGGAPGSVSSSGQLSITNGINAGTVNLRPSITSSNNIFNKNPSVFTINAADITVNIISGCGSNPATAPVIQSINIHIPQLSNVPIPTLEMANLNDWHDNNLEAPYPSAVTSSSNQFVFEPGTLQYYTRLPYNRMNYQERLMPYTPLGFLYPGGVDFGRLVCRGDTTRSIQPNPNSKYGADLRLTGALPVVPAQDSIGNYVYQWAGGANASNPFIPCIHSNRIQATGGQMRRFTIHSHNIQSDFPLRVLLTARHRTHQLHGKSAKEGSPMPVR